MPVKDVVIRAQELGGRIVSLGSDSARGIVVEDLTADSDTWGSRSCSFTLRRNPRVPWPDIGAFAPLEIESQGLLVWSGRVKGTPTTDGNDRRITVNGEGWQYHLDDDSYQRMYVGTTMNDWVDVRGLTSTPLASFVAAWQVTTGQGGLSLIHPAGVALAANKDSAVIYDTGVPGGAVRIVIFASNTLWGVAGSLYAKASDTLPIDLSGASSLITLSAGAASGVYAATLATPGRYVILQIDQGAYTPAADASVQFSGIYVFADTNYEAFNASALQAHKVIKDALTRATLLLSSDQSLIQSTTFLIPDFKMTKPDTPRNVINAVNAYHMYQTRVGVDKRFEFRPQPSSASIQVDQRSTFDEASAGDASEMYSGVILNYTGPDGASTTTQRAQQGSLYGQSAIQPTNPGAEVNTTGWTSLTGTLSRTTVGGEFTAGVGGFKTVGTTSNIVVSTVAWTGGAFVAGQAYRITFDGRASTANGIYGSIVIDGATAAVAFGVGDGAFHALTLDWVQTSASTPTFYINGPGPGGGGHIVYWDNMALYEAQPTLVNRRGFRRTFTLDTNMSLSGAAAQQIGDVFLTQHKTIPLKGKVVVSGYGLASKSPSGVGMPPAELLLNTGELVRLAHLIDQDTGAIGREGRIASVSWDAVSDTTTLELDSQVSNFEAFIGRLGILTGQVR